MTETQAAQLIKISEAATIADVSYVHLWRLVSSGELPAVRVGPGHGPLRINRQTFLDWLDEKTK